MNSFRQQGFLSIVAILLIVVIAVLGSTVAYMLNSAASSTTNFALSEAAFDIAEGGLQEATRYLSTPVINGTATRVSCAALSGNTNLTNASLGRGAFTVSTVSGSPFYANDVLNGAITNSATTVTVTSTAGFAPSGRIVIDKEKMNYTAISGNSFIGVTRGVDQTSASSHANGAYVGQYQCSLTSTGGIPNMTAPLWRRTVNRAVMLQDAYAVGNTVSGNFVIIHWNYPNELQWTDNSLTNTNRVNLTDISLLSNAEGWAVGPASGTNFIYLHLTGSAWSVVTLAGACSGQTVNGVSTISSTEAFSVGSTIRTTTCSSGKYRYGIQRWNGSSWVELSSSTTPSIPADSSTTLQPLNAISVIDTGGDGIGNFGFAVGNNGIILQYNGSSWSAISSPVSQTLNDVYVVSTNEAWAVGNSGTLLKYNGSTWSSVSSPTSTTLNRIKMLDTNSTGTADTGWAVGNNGVAIVYNGSTWSSQNTGLSNNLFSVTLINSNDVWAVGTSGKTVHWDGSAWTSFTSNTSVQLNGIASVKYVSPVSAWNEVFP